MFLISIIVLHTYGLHTDVKFFGDDTSLFSVVCNTDESTFKLNDDLNKATRLGIQMEFFFSDRAKLAQEAISSQKTKNIYPNL